MYEKAQDVPERDPFETLVDVLTAATRYDLALGIIPSAFAVALVAASVLGIPVQYALLPAAAVGAMVFADACYLNPPIDPDQGSDTA
ncbi:hypothetical protein [Halostagnicola kamekurae]|uniref:Uncharacterized protein n=1 Tax=Halostagnicola kamekurae TaxID=619731 RepID=A0A1I6PDC0_9EURY|nr:hypothetical protein [Halostagnicola kamekurae]SFS38179.1 hypothetical protein SAMN04488556_0479 [Halostagnicola kamekurae]